MSSQEVESAAGLSGRMKGGGGVGGAWQQQGQSTGPPPPPGGQWKTSLSFTHSLLFKFLPSQLVSEAAVGLELEYLSLRLFFGQHALRPLTSRYLKYERTSPKVLI